MAMRKPGPYVALSATYADDEKIMEAGEIRGVAVRMLDVLRRTPLSRGGSVTLMESRLRPPRRSGKRCGNSCGNRCGSRAESCKLPDSSHAIGTVGASFRGSSGTAASKKWAANAHVTATARPAETTEPMREVGNGAGVPLPIRADRSDQKKLHARAPASAREDRFTEFWMAYPKKVAKGAAERCWAKAVKTTDPDVILAGLQRRAPRLRSVDPQFVKHLHVAELHIVGGRASDERRHRRGRHRP